MEKSPENKPRPRRSSQTFLLNIWQEARRDDTGEMVWRLSLQEAGSDQRHGFANCAALVTFLQERMADVEAGAPENQM